MAPRPGPTDVSEVLITGAVRYSLEDAGKFLKSSPSAMSRKALHCDILQSSLLLTTQPPLSLEQASSPTCH